MKKVLLSLAVSVAVVGLGAAFTACSSSSSSPDTNGTPEAGADARKEAGQPVDDGGTDNDSGQTSEQCLAACEQKYAAGLTLDKKIDDCWTASCNDPCVNGTGTFDAGAGGDAGDAGDAGGDGGACQNPVETGDNACNACTIAFCCGAWDGCFNNKDCSDLNDCRSQCP